MTIRTLAIASAICLPKCLGQIVTEYAELSELDKLNILVNSTEHGCYLYRSQQHNDGIQIRVLDLPNGERRLIGELIVTTCWSMSSQLDVRPDEIIPSAPVWFHTRRVDGWNAGRYKAEMAALLATVQ